MVQDFYLQIDQDFKSNDRGKEKEPFQKDSSR